MARVFADTNVLFPFSVMGLLLTLAEDYVHDLVWSEHLLDEWQRVIVREGRRSTEAAALIAGHIRIGFSDSCVPEDHYKHLLAEIDGPDPDDVHHMAAAIAGNADTLITWNLDDFPAKPWDGGASRSPPDLCLCALLDQQPVEVLTTIGRMARRKQRPPMTSYDITDALARAGIPAFAQRARRMLDG